jgi:hypothetical protein
MAAPSANRLKFTPRTLERDVRLPGRGDETRQTRYWDAEARGLGLLVSSGGAKTFISRYKAPSGKWLTRTLGRYGTELTIEQARAMAAKDQADAKQGIDPRQGRGPAQGAETFGGVAGEFLVRHVGLDPANRHVKTKLRTDKLRTDYEIRRILKTYILPSWAERPFSSIKRAEVIEMLDRVEDENGARQADMCLAIVRTHELVREPSRRLPLADRQGHGPLQGR